MKPVFHIVALSGISILMLPWSIQISLEWLMFLNHFSKRFMLTCSVEVLYFSPKSKIVYEHINFTWYEIVWDSITNTQKFQILCFNKKKSSM